MVHDIESPPARAASPRGVAANDPAASDQSARQRHSLQSYFELSRELDYSLDVAAVADLGLFNFMGHLGTSSAVLWLLPSSDSSAPIVLRSHGLPEAVATEVGARCIRKLADRFVRSRQVISISDAHQALDRAERDVLYRSGLSLFALLPTRRMQPGVVALGRRVGAASHDPFELEVLHASLDLLAVAMDNATLHAQLLESNRELHRANEGLHELDRLKAEFLRNLHHELRTPLAVIQAYLESLLEDVPAGEQHEHVQVVMNNALKLKTMLLNLLDLSGLTNNSLVPDRREGDVTAVLRDYYEKRQMGVALQLREFRMAEEPDVPKACFDTGRFVQILDILVDNAVKFTPQGSHITLRVKKESSGGKTWARIDVEDDGPGIPADCLPTLFLPFRQLDGSTTRAVGGMGVGLALARQLAEVMCGRLDVVSRVGKGTTFTLLLPEA